MIYPIKKLGEISKTTSGGTPLRSNNLFWGGKIAWLKSGELGDNFNISKSSEFITKEGLKKSSAKMFNKGTLLIAMYGATAGKLGILDFDATTNQAVCSIQNNQNLFIEKYIFLYLLMIRKKIIQDSFGGAQPNISKGYLDKINIPLPPLPTQKLIVQKLDSAFKNINESIKITKKNIENIEELNKSSLDNVFKNGNFDEEIFGEICDFVRGPFGGSLKKEIFKKTGYAIYEQMHAIRNQYTEVRYFIDEEKFNEMKRFELSSGNLIMSCSGTMGKVSIVPEGIKKGIINQALLALKPNDKLLNKYLKLFMESGVFQEEITKYSKGAAIKNIASVKILKQIKIPLPPLPKQKEIVSYLDKVFEKNKILKEGYEKKLKDLQEMKQSILKEAFEGRLVKD